MFWHIWQETGANPQVVSILKEGYALPFKMRPPLTRSPLIPSGYANPAKNRFLKEALLALMNKLVVERVVVKSSLAFYNRLFLVSKPNKKWRPILDLSQLNLYLSPDTFKMETRGNNPVILTKGGMGNLSGFQRRVFPHSYLSKVNKLPEVLPEQLNLPVHCSSLWFGHGCLGIYKGGQRSEAYGTGNGYLNPAVSR